MQMAIAYPSDLLTNWNIGIDDFLKKQRKSLLTFPDYSAIPSLSIFLQ